MAEMKLFWQIGQTIKQIICNVNNDIPVKISSFPYVLVNTSVLCNCGREAENNFLLESLAAISQGRIQISDVFHSEYSYCQLPWQPNWNIVISYFARLNHSWTNFTNLFTVFSF